MVVGAGRRRSLASSSKYCIRSFTYPSPDSDPPAFLRAVMEASVQYDRPVLLPMTDATVNEILLNRNRFPEDVLIPFPDHDRYDALADKERLFRQAKELAIPMPETLFSSDFTSRDSLVSEAVRAGFPLVVKAAHSRERAKGTYLASSATYANDRNELKAILGKAPYDRLRCLVQKRVQGRGIGIFLLARNGDILARFAHRRIREKPPSGGVSVLCESIDPPPEALNAASRLISVNKWHGVAMVEFKWDDDENRPKLIEVNGRFWGSLNLAIRAGVDFPFLLHRLAVGENVEDPGDFRIGLKSRWEFGDLDHLLIRLKKHPGHPSVSGTRITRRKACGDFLADFFRPSVLHEVFDTGDPWPFLFEAKEYARNLVSRS